VRFAIHHQNNKRVISCHTFGEVKTTTSRNGEKPIRRQTRMVTNHKGDIYFKQTKTTMYMYCTFPRQLSGMTAVSIPRRLPSNRKNYLISQLVDEKNQHYSGNDYVIDD